MRSIYSSARALRFPCFIVAIIACSCVVQAGSRSSANYSITQESTGAGGLNAQSAAYSLRGSAVGELGASAQGSMTSASYLAEPGFAGQVSDLLMRAASRLTHNGAGTFDVNLPLSGTPGTEPRSSSVYTVVFTFANPLVGVQNVSASATGSTQPGASSGAIDPNDAHNYIVNLTALPNAQLVTVTLGTVNDTDGNFAVTLPLTMGMLIGDSNGDGVVNSADATITRNHSGLSADATNFRSDYNVDGVINSADATVVRARSGTSIP